MDSDTLGDFVLRHTDRGECRCGKCFDRGDRPDPPGHTADVMFFPVSMVGTPARGRFLALIREHAGVFCPCDPLDGNEHGYMELGGWLGDQQVALRFMGIGSLIGVFDLLTPRSILSGIPDDVAMQMAGSGLVTVRVRKAGD